MVLGSLLGYGDSSLSDLMENSKFKPSDIMYVGLQGLHEYQEKFLNEIEVNYKIQTESIVSDEELKSFVSKFEHILIHMDIDVLDEHLFHSTYFANLDLVGDGAAGGKMTMERLSDILFCIENHSKVVGFTIAEYLPFDEHRLYKMLAGIKMFTD